MEYTLEQQKAIVSGMIADGTLVENKANGEKYIVLSEKAVSFNPRKLLGYELLSKFTTFAGFDVELHNHTVYGTDEVAKAVKLKDPGYKPEWMIAAGL